MGEEDAIVIDLGSDMIKAGFAGDDTPRAVFPSIVGTVRRTGMSGGMATMKSHYVGDAAMSLGSHLTLHHPFNNNGVVSNVDFLEKLLHHTYYEEVRVAPEELPLLVTEPVSNSEHNRSILTEMLFETFSVPALCISPTAPLHLYAAGISTGLVVDVGDTVSSIVPIYNRTAIPSAIIRLDYSGRHLTDFLVEMLVDLGHSLVTTYEFEIVRDIKEKLAKVAISQSESESYARAYEFRDERVLTLGKELIKCPEALFKPSLIDVNSSGIHSAIYSSVLKCPQETHDSLLNNIMLAGGSTLFPGFDDRLQHELKALSSKSVKFVSSRGRKYTTWIGGSMFAKSATFSKYCVSKHDYDEHGAAYMNKFASYDMR